MTYEEYVRAVKEQFIRERGAKPIEDVMSFLNANDINRFIEESYKDNADESVVASAVYCLDLLY